MFNLAIGYTTTVCEDLRKGMDPVEYTTLSTNGYLKELRLETLSED
jgi:hypothetical protein